MNLNDIKLHPQLLAGLYPGTLIETRQEKTNIQAAFKEDQTFSFLGKNKKNIVIIVYNEKEKYLHEVELKFLSRILKAVHFTLDDVAVVNIKKQPAGYSELDALFQSKAVLLFGAEPKNIDLPVNFPQFQLQSFNNCTYLHAPALNEIENEKVLKQQLWECLKNLFGL